MAKFRRTVWLREDIRGLFCYTAVEGRSQPIPRPYISGFVIPDYLIHEEARIAWHDGEITVTAIVGTTQTAVMWRDRDLHVHRFGKAAHFMGSVHINEILNVQDPYDLDIILKNRSEEAWYVCQKLHRVDGPAFFSARRDIVSWHVHGRRLPGLYTKTLTVDQISEHLGANPKLMAEYIAVGVSLGFFDKQLLHRIDLVTSLAT